MLLAGEQTPCPPRTLLMHCGRARLPAAVMHHAVALSGKRFDIMSSFVVPANLEWPGLLRGPAAAGAADQSSSI